MQGLLSLTGLFYSTLSHRKIILSFYSIYSDARKLLQSTVVVIDFRTPFLTHTTVVKRKIFIYVNLFILHEILKTLQEIKVVETSKGSEKTKCSQISKIVRN